MKGDLRALSGSLSLPLAIAFWPKKKRFMVRVHMIWRKKKRVESRNFACNMGTFFRRCETTGLEPSPLRLEQVPDSLLSLLGSPWDMELEGRVNPICFVEKSHVKQVEYKNTYHTL